MTLLPCEKGETDTEILKVSKLKGEMLQNIALINNNLPAQQIVCCWPNVTIHIEPIQLTEEEKANYYKLPVYVQLWKNVFLDYDEISFMSAVPRGYCEQAVEMCKRNFFIFPDNTAREDILAFINMRVGVNLLRQKRESLPEKLEKELKDASERSRTTRVRETGKEDTD